MRNKTYKQVVSVVDGKKGQSSGNGFFGTACKIEIVTMHLQNIPRVAMGLGTPDGKRARWRPMERFGGGQLGATGIRTT